MNMKKKRFGALLSVALGVLIASAVTTTAYAKVTAYIVNDTGKIINFNTDALIADYTNKLLGKASPMFDAYLARVSNLTALQDSIKGFVSYESVEKAYEDALIHGEGNLFNMDSFTENASAADIENITVGYQCDSDGAIAAVSDTNDNIVTFKDANLEQAVRQQINKPTGDIYKSDVEEITSLVVKKKGIQYISGIENLINLQTLRLSGNQINDISALKQLTKLRQLHLDHNQLSDISELSGVTNLQELDLGENQISDIGALRGLTNLQGLNLVGNKISDINALKGLTNLQELSIGVNSGDNQVSDISALSGLANLTYLDLGGNKISDISVLKGLTNLTYLNLRENQISDVSGLKGLANLTYLDLYGDEISDTDKQSLREVLPNCSISY